MKDNTMKNIRQIKDKLELIKARWDSEIEENSKSIDEAEERLSVARAELEKSEDPSEYAFCIKRIEDAENEISFYQMKKKNFNHQLNALDVEDYRKTLEKCKAEIVQTDRKKIVEAFDNLYHLINSFEDDLREINEAQNLLADLSGQANHKKSFCINAEDICGIPVSESMYNDFSDFSRYYIQRKMAKLNLRNSKLIN